MSPDRTLHATIVCHGPEDPLAVCDEEILDCTRCPWFRALPDAEQQVARPHRVRITTLRGRACGCGANLREAHFRAEQALRSLGRA